MLCSQKMIRNFEMEWRKGSRSATLFLRGNGKKEIPRMSSRGSLGPHEPMRDRGNRHASRPGHATSRLFPFKLELRRFTIVKL